jgi:hypothetical protein
MYNNSNSRAILIQWKENGMEILTFKDLYYVY